MYVGVDHAIHTTNIYYKINFREEGIDCFVDNK